MILACSVASAWAGTEPASDNILQPNLRFDHVAGMAKGAVTAITQDGAGFIWFGTDEGLSRYDGYQFVNYSPEADFTVTAVVPGKDELWIGSTKGLQRLDLATKKFTALKTDPKNPNTIASDYVVSLYLGKSVLWIGTADAGVDALNLATREVKHYRTSTRPDSLSGDEVSVVFEDKDGRVWIGTRDAGLNQLDPATGKVTRFVTKADEPTSLSNDSVDAIYQDSGGALWVGTMEGLNRYDPATRAFHRYFAGADDPQWVTTIIEGTDHALWLGIKEYGVYRFDQRSGAVEKYAHSPADSTSLASLWPRSTFSDRSGVLWFGFNAMGVSKLSLMRRDFTFYRTNPGLSFLEDGDRVWLGSRGFGLRLLDLKTGELKRYLDEELSRTWTTTIVAGDRGSLWLGTSDLGLFHFTPKTGEVEVYDTKGGALVSDAVFSLLRDGEWLWVGTFGGGLGKFDPNKKVIEYLTNSRTNESTLSSDFIVALAPDRARPNVLWVGTTAGLNELDKRNNKAIRYVHDPAKPNSLSHDHVTDIHEDRAGRLWVATWGGGLNLLDRTTKTFTAFGSAQGLASNVVFGIMEDKTGALWLTTDDGLTKFDPDKHTSVNFREGDGLQDDEFGQGTFHQGASGRFYVGGPRGFNVFVPESLKTDQFVPPVVLTKFEILGEARSIPEKVSLSFRDRWFGVEFSALAYSAPERNRYKYRLKGFHDWIETDRRFVSYASLPPGDYTLEILGSNAHGVWNTEGLRLPIHVAPPPWRTWWAYTAYGMLLLLIIGLIVLYQRSQIDRLRREHRLTELEHEIALTSVIQEGFLPAERSVRDGAFRLEGFYRPAAQCGGDWWSYENRGDEYVIIVGDATGHGAHSAMVTAAAASCFRSLRSIVDDEARLRAMNEEVYRVSRGQYHMTLTSVDLNVVTGEFAIRSAGGVPVFSLPPNERPRVLMCPGTPLGTPEFEVGRLDGRLVPGERLLILTDGIPEVALANTQLLGPRGVANFYMQTRDQELGGALQQLIAKVEEIQVGLQDDDWTVVMVEWGDAQTHGPNTRPS